MYVLYVTDCCTCFMPPCIVPPQSQMVHVVNNTIPYHIC